MDMTLHQPSGIPQGGILAHMTKPSIDEIVNLFEQMTLAEVTEFRKQFETTFGVTAEAPVVTVVQTEQPTEVEEQTEFDVILESAGDKYKKIGVIKVVREITKLGLKEAKDFVESAPKPVFEGITKAAAEEARLMLTAAGAQVTIR